MKYLISVSTQSQTKSNNYDKNDFNLTEGFTVPIILILITLLINTVLSWRKSANEENISDIIKKELEPVSDKLKQVEKQLTKSGEQIIELKGARELTAESLGNGLTRVETNLKADIKHISDRTDRQERDMLTIVNENKILRENINDLKLAIEKLKK